MRTNVRKPDPGADARPHMHEADIGSGERSPAQHETDAMIREIPPRGHGKGDQTTHQPHQPHQPNQHTTRDDKPGKA